MSFVGRSFIVTGGGSGIGRETALMISQQGGAVTVLDRNADAGENVAAEIQRSGGRGLFVRCDVTDENDVREGVQRSVAAFGSLNGAVNAAGAPMHGRRMHELSAAEFEQNMAVNLRGMFFSMKHQITAMLGGGGSIVAIGSTASVVGVRNAPDYCAAKAGVLGLVRSAAADYADLGIRVNAILPGGIVTPMMENVLTYAANREKVLSAVPMGRLGAPAEIASGALWLLSDGASYATGMALTIDGGKTAL